MEVDYESILYEIAQGNYRYIGSGSARRVFDLGNGYVIKIAKNDKGLAQNQVEFMISNKDDSGLFARVMDMSSNGRYLIMERAGHVYDIREVFDYFNVRSERYFLHLTEIQKIVSKYDLVKADLLRPTSWGSIRREIVIIDYGFTHQVRANYYHRRRG